MGNRNWFVLFIFFSIHLLSGSAYAVKTGDVITCPFDLSVLSFVGEKFGGSKTICVKASNDDEGRNACLPKGLNYINPGNPDYLKAARGQWGDLSSNTLGFYFCNNGRKKVDMCNEAGARPGNEKLKLHWSSRGTAKHKDGICECDKDPNKPGMDDCSSPDLPDPVADNKCTADIGQMKDPADPTNCICMSNYTEDSREEKIPVCRKNGDPNTPPKPVAQGGIDPDLKKCVDEKVEASKLCVSSAKEAVKRCDQANKDNPEVVEALKVPGQIANAYVGANAGKGMTAECFKAAVISNSTNIALKNMPDDCKSNFETCQQQCKPEEKLQEFIRDCEGKRKYVAPPEGEDPVANPSDDYYHAKKDELIANLKEGTPICKDDAAKKSNILSSLLGGLANSLKAGAICACQAAASVTGQSATGCSSTPTAAQCLANPALSGCVAFQAIDICSIGSQNYSYQGCKCQSDPKGVGCPAYAAANPNNAGFAGPDVKMPSASGAGIGPATGAGNGTGGAEGLDLSSQKADDASAGAKPNAAGPGFLGGAGGGGAGGVGSGGGGGGSPGEPAKEADGGNGNSGGIFGQAKSFMGNLFGGGGKQNAALGKATANKVDTDKFKPKGSRGVAGNSSFGGKNMDIWLMMNNRYEENQNTFILSP